MTSDSATQSESNPDREAYHQAHQLFLASLEIEPQSERESWVTKQTSHSEEVRSMVLGMLRADAAWSDRTKQQDTSLSAIPETIAAKATPVLQHSPSTPSFDNYEIHEEIARGGMGVVYKARQLRPNRWVAIKMIRRGTFASTVDIDRFFVEAEAASQLDSESVVPVYEYGEVHGEPYIAMKYIDGENLETLLQKNAVAMPEFLRQLITICRAVAVAHERGIIHRDIKPSNILVEHTSGRPWITDFGLAKYLERDSSATAAGDVIGTPGYMAPELALGNSNHATRAVDVYGLGAVLYRGLTGRPPIPTGPEGLLSMIQRIREHDVVAPRSIHHRIPHALNTICMKCLDTDPARRYLNAKELADDLQRFLNDEPIHAKPLGLTRRLHRWARNRPGLAVAWCGLAVFYAYHLFCYSMGFYPDPNFHLAATMMAAMAATSAWVWQWILTRTQGSSWVLYLWLTSDLLCLTTLLFWANSANSHLVLLYHVIVAGSILRCRKALVAYATLAAMAGYSIHLLYLLWNRPQEVPEIYQSVPTMLSLFLIGIIQYFSLLQSSSSYEARGAKGPFGELVSRSAGPD
jgi:eukaryotic-like serine/threonine-protein kinase